MSDGAAGRPDRVAPKAWPWAVGVVLLSLLPVAGLVTTTRVFYIRDLSFFFWSRHLWLRHTLFSRQWPWWDPFVAAGQPAIADALNQLAMPVTMAIRLLPSDVMSFNLWVALPLPLTALGMFAFLRQLFARDGGLDPRAAEDAARGPLPHAAAAFGATLFALSGPIVSMANTPNLAWSGALLPWVMTAVTGARPFLWTALAFGLQGLCGEPVTWAATGLFAAAWSAARVRARALAPLAGLAFGGLLAAAQLVPTMLASVRAHRAMLATPDFWSLHPLSLWETLAPHLFGNYHVAVLDDLPWMAALNFGRDPFFYSLYLGPLGLMLACAAAARPRRHAFWIAATVVFTIAAMGGYTPAYPLARRLLPALTYFRFPVKYLVFAIFAIAVLAAEGWRARMTRTSALAAAGVGGLVLIATLGLLAAPALLATVAQSLAAATHLKDVAAGAEAFTRAAPRLAFRLGATLLCGGLLATVAVRRPAAWMLVAAMACLDLLITNIGLNPTIDVNRLEPPAWFTAAAGSERIYIGGRVRGFMNPDDPDAAPAWQLPAETDADRSRMTLNAELPMAPSGWRVREALSYDLPYLWPAEYEAAVARFEQASDAERAAFLQRSGVRWCVVGASQPRSWRAVAEVADWNMRVYECHPGVSRVALLGGVPPAESLFDPAAAEHPIPGTARITEDRSTDVVVETSAGTPSVLVLRDSFDPSWRAAVDGQDAAIVRAYGLYRAVALPAGRHVIRFSYRPRDFLRGLTLTVTALLVIACSGVFRFFGSGRGGPASRSRGTTLESRERGFTLIELMVVLAIIAIVMSIAFTEYRNMQARGNEVSALSSLRSIAAAQWQFATTCGNMKYATTLAGLGQPVPATGAAFLSPDLTAGETIEKSGYAIKMTATPLNDAPPACNGSAVAAGYAATADPLKPNVSGMYFYGVNADRVLYIDKEKSFKEGLPESGGAQHGAEVK